MSATQIPQIPDHEVLRVIGRGAYGEIWMARSLTGALRAVKLVHRSTFESERAFRREFEGMSSFEPISRAHPGFVNILHVGRTDAFFYYIMELADDHTSGRDIHLDDYVPKTLKTELDRRGRLPVEECIQLGLSLTDALRELHTHRLTHRDIKPANIIFVKGVPKLADIGLVAVSGQRSFVGTEGYVPPEGPGTAPADLYSLGKVLYEISMGKDRLDFPEVATRLSELPDKVRLLRLNGVLLKACATDAAKRYATAHEMNGDLALVQSGERRKRSGRRNGVLAAISVLALAAIAAWWFHEEKSGARVTATIRTEPAGALVLLGDMMKKSPATFSDLEPGKYPLRVMSPGFEAAEQKLDLRAKAELPVIKLRRSKGSLRLATEPAGATFRLFNGTQTLRSGTTPATLEDLPTGAYEIALERGDAQARDRLEIKRNETTSKEFSFAMKTLEITSEPDGCEIVADGKSLGKTPVHAQLRLGAHELLARLDGWPEQRQTIELTGSATPPVRFEFATGSAKITSAPGGASVWREGVELGQTPLLVEEIRPGEVDYELRLAGYKNATVRSAIVAKQQAFLAARLEKKLSPEPGQSWVNSLGMPFVPVEKVRFCVWETRVQDYDAFCAATARVREKPGFPQTPLDPVVKVSWHDAEAFCKWLTEKERAENLLEERQFYRLPGDLEWSAAVGLEGEGGNSPEERDGKVRGEFPWSKTWPPPPGAGNYADQSGRRARGKSIEGFSDGFSETAPAGSFAANQSGIFDLGGNVWEWIEEGYKGSGTTHGWGVLRGGSWANSVRGELQSSYRNVVDRNDRDVIYGFRCVLVSEGAE